LHCPPIIPEIIEQHAEEAAFLWLLRDAAVLAPHYLVEDLGRLDNRVEAHLDGLRIAGEPGWEIVKAQLVEIGGPGEMFAAAVLAFEERDESKVAEVLVAGVSSPERARASAAALGWLEQEAASRHIKPLLNAPDPVLKRIGIAAAAARPVSPGADILQNAFASNDPPLRARALRAVGELGVIDLQHALRANLRAKEPACRFWAAWSLALLNGHADAVACLQGTAEAGRAFAERAAAMAMRRVPPKDAKIWLKRLVRELGQQRVAIVAAGAFADPEVIPFLIDQMKCPSRARVAGEAFSLITGAHMAYDKLEATQPEGFDVSPSENPEDDAVAMDLDESLAWPDPALVQKWWNAHQGQFSKGTRYLLGQPITPESLRAALKNGYQRQRAAAALELAILNPGRPLFEVRAPGFRQQKLLA
jgi:uncharacterized protein (TIGR02270 family)